MRGSAVPDDSPGHGEIYRARICDGAIQAAALSAAAAQMKAPITAAVPKAENKAGPVDAKTGPIRAVATRPPVRATALFNPDATPV